MAKSLDVVALGEPLLEFNQTQAGKPNYLQGFGGDTCNAVIAAARAGARCAYLTRVGDDAFGKALFELWMREGVDSTAVTADGSHPTGIYFVTHDEQGHHFSYLRAGSAASRMQPDWLMESWRAEMLRQTAWLHVSGISMAISSSACDTAYAAMRMVREAGGRVSFDPNLRLRLWPLDRARACIAAAVAQADLFLPSLEDGRVLCGQDDPQDIVQWGHDLGARWVVLKLGEDGVLVSDGQARRQLLAHRVPELDATGAGDCFDGNLLARLAHGDDLFEAARYANAAAALSVQGYGAIQPLPRPPAVRALLQASS